jgi:alpha-beta hydrolase superfamily lysophospholipase
MSSFLYDESMGSVIFLSIYLVGPKGFNGVILVTPMSKISEKHEK